MGSSLELRKSSSHRHNSRVGTPPQSKRCPIGEDELIRHMSNLPGYLLHSQRVENLKEKVLNVGVLDWTRLENWKHQHMRCPTEGKDCAVCSWTHLSLDQTIGLSTEKAFSSRQSGSISSHKEVTAVRNASQSQDFDSCSKSAIKGRRKIERNCTSSSSEGNVSNMMQGKERTKRSGRTKSLEMVDFSYNYFTCKQDVNLQLKQKSKDLEDGFPPLNSGTSLDENMTDLNSCSYSEIFSPAGNLLSSECCSNIPYSCPLPSLADVNPMRGRMQDPLVCDTSAELSCLRPSGGKQTEKGESDIKLTHFDIVDTRETLDDKTPDPEARKGSHPLPIRAVMSKNTGYPDSSDRKKVSGHNRTRSSPFKRLIQPILKHKSSNPQHPIEGNVNSLGRWPTGLGSAHDNKHAESPMQALLQFTIMNGFPLFKLLVDNSRNVLVAKAKDLTPSGKNGSGQSYTFYLVNEIKSRTSDWIRPGNRDRSYGYAYNVIGQMQLNSDYESNEYSNGKYMIIESILFGVEMRPEDGESAMIMKSRELAAMVLKVPTENSKHDGQQSCNVLIENRMKFLSEDNGVVILPGAVHGSPSSGQPSPLINRWRSGGACDCGGWDIGCKLRILSIPNKVITSKACPISKCLELFVQGDEQEKPVCSMTPLKGGFFEVCFDSSISMLQAFFICVTILNGQKLEDPSQIKYPKCNGINTVRENHQEVDSNRYATNPPVSPVGRV